MTQFPSFIEAPASAVASFAGMSRAPARTSVFDRNFTEIGVHLDSEARTFWCQLRPSGRPCVSPAVLRDLSLMQSDLTRWMAGANDETRPFDHFVVASDIPGVFNLGGDLRLFAESVRQGHRSLLQQYAYRCVEVVHNNLTCYHQPLVTIALVQGDALGGGFETALSCGMIAAERGTKFGLPEVLFNLFPGMGAYSLIARRIGAVQAERMILSGRLYTAEELHEIGLVDLLLTPGQGVAELRAWIAKQGRRHVSLSAVHRARNIATPVTLQELRDVVDVWVDTAMRLGAADLRKMERLAAAQDRRRDRSGSLMMAAE